MIQYEYDTSPRKIKANPKKKSKSKPYLLKTKKTAKKVKDKPNLLFAMSIVFVMLFIIIYQNSMVNQSFSQLQSLKKQAITLQKENDQLEVNIQNSINLNNIETSAKEILGMQKLTSAQTVYLNLEKQDSVEATAEAVIIEEEKNIMETIRNKIINLF